MNLLEEIAYHLEFERLGKVPNETEDGNIYYGKLPDDPSNAIAIMSSDSSFAGSEQGARIQILVRGESFKKAYNKSVEIVEAINYFSGFLHGDGMNASIFVENGPSGLGTDGKKRELYSINIRVYYCN